MDARGKFGEHERSVRIARGDSGEFDWLYYSFLSDIKTVARVIVLVILPISKRISTHRAPRLNLY